MKVIRVGGRGWDCNRTETSVHAVAGLRPTGGGLCPPPLAPRAGGFAPHDPPTARAARSPVPA